MPKIEFGNAGNTPWSKRNKARVKKCVYYLKKQSPGRLIMLGFVSIILLGTILLMLPISVKPGMAVTPIDALFTSTSAVCVTGLIVVDTADHFTAFGRAVIALLIQTGGLGVATMGVSFILLAGKRVDTKSRLLMREAMNVSSGKGIIRLLKSILWMTVCFELVGTIFSFIVFVQDFPPLKALEISLFHSIASFNNAGFDMLGSLQNLIPYRSDILMNLITCILVFFGGIGFLVIQDLIESKSYKKLCLHSKVVLATSAALILVGTLLLKLTENVSWLGAFFHSVSARTAGFSTYAIGAFSNAGLFALMILMFIGASPGSTGGGIKTSTIFVLLQSINSFMRKKHVTAFHRSIPEKAITKAHDILLLALLVVCGGTLLLSILEPEYSLVQILFEMVSAFGTVGLSTGITPDLGSLSKVVLTAIMLIGRMGVLTLTSLWNDPQPVNAYCVEESITIG